MMAHKDDIYSRPKRTWFTTEREKKLLAKAAKVSSSIFCYVLYLVEVLCIYLITIAYTSIVCPFFCDFVFLIDSADCYLFAHIVFCF
jgi:hypothetical protein